MKVISLNTWGGRAGKKDLLAFFERHRDVDVFLLQEMWSAPYEHLEGMLAGGLQMKHDDIMVYGVQEISDLLSGHAAYFRPHHLDNYGLLTLVKNDWVVCNEGDVFVYHERGHVPEGDVGFHARNLQYTTLETPQGLRTVLNLHGLWNGQGKGDSVERIAQSERMLAFVKTLDYPYVLCGDFNLLPDTKSLQMLEAAGLRNLIREHGITSTRTRHYTKPNKYADYAFVSPGVTVRDFRVLPDEVSDHSPLYLEFE